MIYATPVFEKVFSRSKCTTWRHITSDNSINELRNYAYWAGSGRAIPVRGDHCTIAASMLRTPGNAAFTEVSPRQFVKILKELRIADPRAKKQPGSRRSTVTGKSSPKPKAA